MEIYFDNCATSFPKPEMVYESMDYYMREIGVNPGRGNYRKAMKAERLVYDARKAVAKILGVKHPSKIVFTSNITESLNLVLKGFVNRGDRVLTTNIEHNAIWRPLMRLQEEFDVQIDQIHIREDGSYSREELTAALAKKPKLFCFTHGSNVLGNIHPLEEWVDLSHEYGVSVLVDAAQTCGIADINAEERGIDFLAFTGHKALLGPMGSGGLYIHGDHVLKTLKEGGTGSASASPFQPLSLPDRYESGTLNVPAIIGLKAAAEYLAEKGIDSIRDHEKTLTEMALKKMANIPGLRIYGPPLGAERLGLISFNLENTEPQDVAGILDEKFGIMVRAGLHCAPQAHRLIGTEKNGAVRLSFGPFNTPQEMDYFVAALGEIAQNRKK